MICCFESVATGAESILEFGKSLGAEPIFDPGERLPRDCSEIWSRGQTMIVESRN